MATPSVDFSDVLGRLERLENTLNQLLNSGANSPSLYAQAFRLQDEAGKVRAKLACGKDGEPGLFLFNKEGKAIASLKLTPEGSRLALRDATQNMVVSASSTTTEGTEIALSGSDGTDQLRLTVFSDNPAIWLLDKNGNRRVVLVHSEAAGTMFALEDGRQVDGKDVVRVLAKVGGDEPTLMISDTSGQSRVSLSFSESDNVGGIKLTDSQGHNRFCLAAGGVPEEPVMSLMDASGEPRISMKVAEEKGMPILMLEGRNGEGSVITHQGIVSK